MVGGKHPRKQLFEQRMNSHSEHLHMSTRHGSPQSMWLHEHWTDMNTHELHLDVGRIALASCSTLNIDIRRLQVRILTVKQDRSHGSAL